MKPLYPCIWINEDASRAADFYARAFPGAKRSDTEQVQSTEMAEASGSGVGDTIVVHVELPMGGKLMLLRGGDQFRPTEGVSLVVECADQEELDTLWAALTSEGGRESQCGWCEDRFGVSWQLVPEDTSIWRTDDPEAAARVQNAMLKMGKLDLAALREAGDAVPASR